MDNITNPNVNPNPLNTGNGNQANLASIPAVQQVNNPAPTEIPHPIMPAETTPLNLDQKLETELSQISEETEKSSQMKKYLIAAIAAVLFLTIAFLAYRFFFSASEEVDSESVEESTTSETNSLSESLSDENAESETATDNESNPDIISNPPGLTINLEENPEGEETAETDSDSNKPSTSEESPVKVER